MISLAVDVEECLGSDHRTLTLPCDLKAELPQHYDYFIVSCSPDIMLTSNDEIQKLNDILDEINSENPEMTAEYLDILLEGSMSGDIYNESFVRRVKDNEFMLVDISGVHASMNLEEVAGRHLATVCKVPFDYGISEDILETLGADAMKDYVDWHQVWSQYVELGFVIVERMNKRYIVHIKEDNLS